jgi:hypothetical protein
VPTTNRKLKIDAWLGTDSGMNKLIKNTMLSFFMRELFSFNNPHLEVKLQKDSVLNITIQLRGSRFWLQPKEFRLH